MSFCRAALLLLSFAAVAPAGCGGKPLLARLQSQHQHPQEVSSTPRVSFQNDDDDAAAAALGSCQSPLQCNARNCQDCACVNGECQCADGWSGDSCETPFCVNRTDGCSGHGTCQHTPTSITCECDPKFTGPHCENQTHCDLNCVHGGTPNEACTTCEDCLVAWVGPTCNIYNSSIDAGSLLSMYTQFFTKLAAEQAGFVTAIEAKYNPVPGWNQVGAAYDIAPSFMNPDSVGLMIFNLSFQAGATAKDKSGQTFNVPDQMAVDLFPPSTGTPPEDSVGFRLLSDLTAYQANAIGAGNGLTGYLAGLTDPSNLDSQFYEKGVSLSQYRTDVVAYNLSVSDSALSSDSSSKLNIWTQQALLSLPETYDATTEPVFEKFFDSFGSSYTTSATFGGFNEDVLAWYSCIWKGASPQPAGTDHGDITGLQNCVLDADNFNSSVAARSYGGQSHPVSTTKFGGDTSCFNETCWQASIAANFSWNTPLIFRAAPRLSTLLSQMSVPSQALAAAEHSRIEDTIAQAMQQAQTATKTDATGPRQVVLQTDAYGACKEGPMNIGDDWTASCFTYTAKGTMVEDSDGGQKIRLTSGSGAAAVSCGCSVASVSMQSNFRRSASSGWAHMCFECGVGVQGSLAKLLEP